jgi:flavin reductase (DIM6/NTAB) family NADH-FMN oxidoreductase RutF
MKIDPGEMDAVKRRLFMGSVICPRPIGWITSVGKNGVVNLAPYSLFSLVSYGPVPIVFVTPQWMVKGNEIKKKDTLRNIEETGEFVVNVVTESLAEAMNITARRYPAEISEVEEAGLTTIPSDLIKPPRIAESPINLECRLNQIIEFGKPTVTGQTILAEVLRVHVRDDLYKDGVIDIGSLHVIGRMGHNKYTRTRDLFNLPEPG